MIHRSYVDQAVDVNARVAYLFVHVSDSLMQARGKTREQNLRDINDCVDYALSRGLIVDFCGGDGTRADMGYLRELLTEVGNKIRFYQPCDTSGLMTPETSRRHIRDLMNIISERVVMHYHNDNGQAIESVIAGLYEGAAGFDSTILGIGERAGNVAMEGILLTLRDKYGVLVEGINYDELEFTVEMVRKMCRGVKPPVVNSERKYPNVSGIHARALRGKRDAFDYDYSPEVVEEMLFFGKHSGKNNYNLLFGEEFSVEEYERMRDEVKKLSREQLRDFTAEEIRKMFGRKDV